MQRSIHFVGTYPLKSDSATMQAMLDVAAPALNSLPSEARRPDWIVEDLRLLEKHPDVEVLKSGRYQNYDDIPLMRVKPGRKLDPNKIELTYHQYASRNWPVFKKLREKYGRPDLPMQINVPGTLQIPMFAFGRPNPLNGLHRRRVFEIALQREVDAIWNDSAIAGPPTPEKNKQLVWQIEIPAEVGGLAKVPESFGGLRNTLAARFFAKGIVRQIAGLPQGARAILHLCNGDLGREGYSHPRSAQLITELVRAVIKKWPKSQVLEAIHFPFASGQEPPSLDNSYYEPLRKLAKDLPSSTRFIAGFVHEKASADEQRRVRDIIEQTIGRKVDIAAACGLGRCTPEVAKKLSERCVQLGTA